MYFSPAADKAVFRFDAISGHHLHRRMDFLVFEPIYQERVWGGRDLHAVLGRMLPGGAPIGESWELVDRPEANSVVARGPFAGCRLRDLMVAHGSEIMGPDWDPARPFPILVKWLDCTERLSLQVHPPAALAAQLGGEPKTENWYVAATRPGAALLAGLRPGVTEAAFRAALAAGTLESLICRLPSRAGDSLYVPSGRVHAIDAGNLILEIQQNSDTTYRVHDWGRVGLDGQPRTLHIEESLQAIDFHDHAPRLLHPRGPETVLADCPAFRLRRLELPAGARLAGAGPPQPRILSVVSGTLVNHDGTRLCRGDNVLLPYAGTSMMTAVDDVVCLITDQFSL
jgi:mannose-6-phosphate isomerase